MRAPRWRSAAPRPLVIEVDDPEAPARPGPRPWVAWTTRRCWPRATRPIPGRCRADEWDAIALNYTSGTTGRPKGVVYHHRGAHLLAMGNVLSASMARHPVYLWTLPMFHCNGWCFPWTVCAVAGTHVCLRAVRGATIWALMAEHGVTHMCGAPIVMATLLDTPAAEQKPLAHQVQFVVAGAPPPEAVLGRMKAAGFAVLHVYGLTECYGPAVVNEWKPPGTRCRPASGAADGPPGRALPGAGSARRDRPGHDARCPPMA